jgi:hypothetical protein
MTNQTTVNDHNLNTEADIRPYRINIPQAALDPSTTPVGVAVFQQSDVAIRYAAQQNNNIVHWSEYDRGTHFPGIDAPDLLISDVRQFFRSLRSR